MIDKTTIYIDVPSTGLVTSLDSTQPFNYVLRGSGVLSGSVSIAVTGTASVQSCCNIRWNGQFTLGVQTVTIGSYVLTSAQVLAGNTNLDYSYDDTSQRPTFATNSFPSVGNEIGDTIVVDEELGNDTTGLRESLLYRFKTLNAALAASETNDEIWVINGNYTQSVAFPHNLSFRVEPSAVINFGDAFNNSLHSIRITGAGQLSCNNIGTTISTGVSLLVQCYSFTFKTISIPSNGFGSQNEIKITASEYIICYTNISILDNIYIDCRLTAPQIFFYNLYNATTTNAIDIENLSSQSYVQVSGEIVEQVNNVSFKYDSIAYCKKDANADFDFIIDKITVKNGVNNEVVYANNNVSATPMTHRFLVRDIINHLGTTGSVLRAFNNGIIQKKGDVYVKQSNNGLAVADTDANIQSYIYFEDSNLYYEGTADNVCTLTNTNSRISFKNTKIISSAATNDIYGIIAGSKYQGLTLYSNLAEGSNCSNEIGSGFVVRDVLIT